MAFKVLLDRDSNNNLMEYPSAYANITRTIADNGMVRVDVQYFGDEDAYNLYKDKSIAMPTQTPFVAQKNFSLEMSKLDLLDFDKADMTITDILKKACYLELKNLPEFEQAIDC